MITEVMKSTVDWCETNYVVLPFVAEFYNTMTGFCIFLAMYAFKRNHEDLFNEKIFGKFGKSMNKIYIYSFLISIGTVLFHGTLFYPFQLLDELPLILIMSEYLNIFKEFHIDLPYTVQKMLKFSSPFAKIACLIIPFTYRFSDYLQVFSFHISLKGFEVLIFLCLYNLSYDKYILFDDDESNLMYKKYINDIEYFSYKGVAIYLLSITAWIIEKFYCNNNMPLELHAIWHILSSLGFHYFNYIIYAHIHLHFLLNCTYHVIHNPPSTPKLKIA